jgi:hypothetical protein
VQLEGNADGSGPRVVGIEQSRDRSALRQFHARAWLESMGWRLGNQDEGCRGAHQSRSKAD